ncbi:MAG: BatA domain-containing protein [Flavipsychrobacter sp.]|nr:BatA domain-containing protein [Flavipsychrobacter sp.]
MSFLYPLFLLSGLALAIPVLIHLFNLRRYKTVFFPHTRFLKNITLNSRRQSQVRYKWLLATRLLFLTALILAFAQPLYTANRQKNTGSHLQVIYVDNSNSMELKKGSRTLLDIAKDAAQRQVQDARAGSKFILLTNDKPGSYNPLPADKVLAGINSIEVSPVGKTGTQVLAATQSLMQSEGSPAADIYYYSDFQQGAFAQQPEAPLLKNITFSGIPVQDAEPHNIYIDTAYLATPVLQTGQTNQLVVTTKATGALPKDQPVLQLSINGQVKSAATLNFNDKQESVDTLSFQVGDAGWQRIALTVNDASIRFDDTFRITARSAPNLSVLALNDGQSNPYIQAAFRAYNGFRLNQADIQTPPTSWKEYNLVILNGVTTISSTMGKSLAGALLQGQSICIFPGRTTNIGALNEGLKELGDIRITGIDTAQQTVSTLQQGSNLVKDLFVKIPANVQLPVANWHYIISAGLSANQQSVLSFRNGDPFLATYTPTRGQLYICATSADLQSGNFPGSYFFVPFLYQMAMQSRSGDVYAVTAGHQQPIYISLNNADERNMVHVYGKGIDMIPPQRPNGAGLDVYIDQAVQQPGFYKLAASSGDTAAVALNGDRTESQPGVWSPAELQNQWKGANIKWLKLADTGKATEVSMWSNFPLWKLCAILAVLMLAAETYLLAGSSRKQTIAA